MDGTQTQTQQFRQWTGSAAFITELQSGTISRGPATNCLMSPLDPSGKVGQSHSTQSDVLKINEDMADANQLTKHA